MTITGQARELRVGYVVKRFPRLSETFILNEILELERQGVDVEVFALRRPEKGVRHALTDQVRARVTYLPGASGIAGWTVRTKQPDWQLRKQQLPKLMAQEDLDLGPLFATPEPEVICKLHLQAATLAMLATGRRIDHLHAHFGTEATTVALLASRMSGIAYSYTAHARDIYHTYVDAETDDRQRRSKLAEARFVVTVSEYNRNYLRNLAGEPAVAERIQRLYNGIDLERFQPQPGARSPNMLLAVGRLIEKKGFSDLVDACATLRQRGTSFRCVIVGDGPLRTALQGQIDAAGLGGQVELRGAQAQNVVVGLMAEASAFVLPCVVAESGDRDGLPTVLLEALAMGVPIVSTSVAGIPEISADGECGLLVPPGEPQTLATAIATLLEDPAFADRLGRAGRLKAETAFDLRKNVAVLRNLFAAAADRPASHEGTKSMRIAYVTADHGIPVFGDKGASIHIQELVRALGNLGHEVVVLAARVGGDERPLGERVIKIRALSELAGKTASDDAATRRLAKERYYIEIAGAVERELHALHAVGGFDLIYERYSLWSAAGVRAARALAVPCVIEMNAPLVLEQRRYRQLVLTAEAEAIEREVLSDARSIAAVSTALRNYAIDNGADPAHVFVLPNGVDTERFHPSGPVASPMPEVDAPVIGFVGSLKPWHGLDTLLDALRTLRDRDVPAHLLIVGDGPLRAWIEGYVSGAGLTDRVTLTGWVGHDAVPSLVRSVDIAVAPYPPLDDFYFSPLKLYEYLAAGRAVVASAIGQVEQAIDDGRTGLLVPAGDPSGLANALERLCRDEPLRRSLGQAAFAAAQGFTWDANARRVIEIAQTLKHAA